MKNKITILMLILPFGFLGISCSDQNTKFIPNFSDGTVPSYINSYVEEFKNQKRINQKKSKLLNSSPEVVGTYLHTVIATEYNLCLLQTYTGKYWTKGQHLYVRQLDSEKWLELSVPIHNNNYYSAKAIIKHQGEISILLLHTNTKSKENWNTVHAMDIKSKEPNYLFSGHTLVVSPNRRYVIYLSSKNMWAGYHPMHVYDLKTGHSLHVMSLWEADPGSGLSFRYKWSHDSKAFLIRGTTTLIKGNTREIKYISIIYHLDTNLLYNVSLNG